jgi:predicted phage tail protein
VAAVQDVQSCGAGAGAGLDADISALTQAAADRSNLADQVSHAQVDAVEDGPQAVQDLTTAFQKSALADRAFAAWATDLKNGECSAGTATRNRHYKDAESASEEAGTAKDGFVTTWSAIAVAYGLPPVTADDF